MELEEGKEQENFVAYVEAYFRLTPSYAELAGNKPQHKQ